MLQKYDTRNQDIKVFVKDGLYHRNDAKVSVFDSSVQGGDAVWEGLRVYDEGVFLLDHHLKRLRESAHALDFKGVPVQSFIEDAIFKTLRANNMYNDCHIRLTLTRGEKITSGMDPRLNQSGCCLIVLAEWKSPVYDNENGIRIISSSIRRNSPNNLDSKIHHNNLINNILAKIQANYSNADDALMLDDSGFISELNGTNVFIVKSGILYTPTADSCLPGITRSIVIDIALKLNIKVVEKNISLTELYNADEAFCTGTMGEITPIVECDGRHIGSDINKVIEMINVEFKNYRAEFCTNF